MAVPAVACNSCVSVVRISGASIKKPEPDVTGRLAKSAYQHRPELLRMGGPQTENRSVGGSIPPLGTIIDQSTDQISVLCETFFISCNKSFDERS